MSPKARLSKDKNNQSYKNCGRINIAELMTKFISNNILSYNTMLPFRNMEDNVGDLRKLFPNSRINNDDVYNFSSPFQTMTNRSSSSADSISPESYFDPFHLSETPRRLDLFPYERAQYDSTPQYNLSPQYERNPLHKRISQSHIPNIFNQTFDVRLNAQAQDFVPSTYTNEPCFQLRRQRAIVGRKLDCQPKPIDEIENIWQSPIQKTYELFPSDSNNRHILGFQTPVKTTSNVSNVSPTSSTSIVTPKIPSFNLFNPSLSKDVGSKLCTFCKKNGERSNVYLTHSVKEKKGNRHVVTCPILRSHVCETCGATNDDAHTITYCPILRSNNHGKPLQSTTIQLKNTRIKSNGRRRY